MFTLMKDYKCYEDKYMRSDYGGKTWNCFDPHKQFSKTYKKEDILASGELNKICNHFLVYRKHIEPKVYFFKSWEQVVRIQDHWKTAITKIIGCWLDEKGKEHKIAKMNKKGEFKLL